MDTINSIDYTVIFEDSLTELVRFIEKGNYSRFFVFTDEHTSIYCLHYCKKKLNTSAITTS